MVIAGTTIIPGLQQQGNAALGYLRSIHLKQENLCYRANTCRQSNVGENTLGNDNSVTGSADQSDKFQRSASPTTLTPDNRTAATTRTATLTVI
jgi:hypothetical protein